MRLVRERELSHRIGQSKSSTYRDITAGILPPPLKYGPRNSVWPEHEIDAVIAARLSGKADHEIKKLVKDLIRERMHALDMVRGATTGSASAGSKQSRSAERA